ncbi:hypothetical protein V5799_026949 [Amblyomma americanum]|uniref:Uncharacterized protein n=1 Tax=Amblyomma americanum TaxID=6943 RepID=A0AAQ4DH38_AMBAM
MDNKSPHAKVPRGADSDGSEPLEPDFSLAVRLSDLRPLPESPDHPEIRFSPPATEKQSDAVPEAPCPKRPAEAATVSREDPAGNAIDQRVGHRWRSIGGQAGEACMLDSESSRMVEDTTGACTSEPRTKAQEITSGGAPGADETKPARIQDEDRGICKTVAASEELPGRISSKDELCSASADEGKEGSTHGGRIDSDRQEAARAHAAGTEATDVDKKLSQSNRWTMWRECLDNELPTKGKEQWRPRPLEFTALDAFSRLIVSILKERQEVATSISEEDNKDAKGESKESLTGVRAPGRQLLVDSETESPKPSTSRASEGSHDAVSPKTATVPGYRNQQSCSAAASAIGKIEFLEEFSVPERLSPLPKSPASLVPVPPRQPTLPCDPNQQSHSAAVSANTKIDLREYFSVPKLLSPLPKTPESLVAVPPMQPTLSCDPNQRPWSMDVPTARKIDFAEDDSSSSPSVSPPEFSESLFDTAATPPTISFDSDQKSCSPGSTAVGKTDFLGDSSPPRISSSHQEFPKTS